MKEGTIRFRYKKDNKIYECDPRRFYEDGHMEVPMYKYLPGRSKPVIETVIVKPGQYEIIPEDDFYEFRRQTARQIMMMLLEKGNDEQTSIDKAIEITDKFIEKL